MLGEAVSPTRPRPLAVPRRHALLFTRQFVPLAFEAGARAVRHPFQALANWEAGPHQQSAGPATALLDPAQFVGGEHANLAPPGYYPFTLQTGHSQVPGATVGGGGQNCVCLGRVARSGGEGEGGRNPISTERQFDGSAATWLCLRPCTEVRLLMRRAGFGTTDLLPSAPFSGDFRPCGSDRVGSPDHGFSPWPGGGWLDGDGVFEPWRHARRCTAGGDPMDLEYPAFRTGLSP